MEKNLRNQRQLNLDGLSMNGGLNMNSNTLFLNNTQANITLNSTNNMGIDINCMDSTSAIGGIVIKNTYPGNYIGVLNLLAPNSATSSASLTIGTAFENGKAIHIDFSATGGNPNLNFLTFGGGSSLIKMSSLAITGSIQCSFFGGDSLLLGSTNPLRLYNDSGSFHFQNSLNTTFLFSKYYNSQSALNIHPDTQSISSANVYCDTKLFPPRMTTTNRDLLTPASGLLVFNSSTNKLNFYNGSSWEVVTSA
jgi:hypothetical protein